MSWLSLGGDNRRHSDEPRYVRVLTPAGVEAQNRYEAKVLANRELLQKNLSNFFSIEAKKHSISEGGLTHNYRVQGPTVGFPYYAAFFDVFERKPGIPPRFSELPDFQLPLYYIDGTTETLLTYLLNTDDNNTVALPVALSTAFEIIMKGWMPIMNALHGVKYWSHQVDVKTVSGGETGAFDYDVTITSSPSNFMYSQRDIDVMSRVVDGVVTFAIETDEDSGPITYTIGYLSELIAHLTKHFDTRYHWDAQYEAHLERITLLLGKYEQ